MSRLILITGASRGIGKSLVAHFIAQGDQVIGVSRSASEFSHADYTHETLDIGDEDAVKKLFARIRTEFSPLYGVINNAGTAPAVPALLTNVGHFQSALSTNVVGSFLISREALKLMRKSGRGRIVNFSSINVPLQSAGGVAYNASKAALENIAGTLSNEVGDADITLNTIGISLVRDTGMFDGLSEQALTDKQEQLSKPKPVSAGDIAHAVEFFLSEQAGGITNQILYFGGIR